MKRLGLLVFMLPMLVFPQTCPNLDFGYGNLTNWQCYSGSCSNGNYFVQPDTQIRGRITVMNATLLQNQGNFYDEHCNIIKKVPDGYDFSCKIGNDSTGSQVDGIEYTMTVDTNNALLILGYAWVMEDPGHYVYESPGFTMRIKDTLGRNIVGIPCSSISFISGNGMDLACSGSIIAKDWNTVGLELTQFIGQTIKIYFETRDCTLGGHFGYAYVVGECRPMRIELAYCTGSLGARMIAPEGFAQYEWTRSSNPSWLEHTRKINVKSPAIGEIFTCRMVSALGCSVVLQTEIKNTVVDVGFNQRGYDTCSRTVTFVDTSKVYNSTKTQIFWEIPKLIGVYSRDSLWTYTFPDPDTPTTYQVRLTVYAENGCGDTSSHYITIYPSPKVHIAGNNRFCEGKTNRLVAQSINTTFTNHDWSWRKNNGETGSFTGDTLTINGAGIYYLKSLSTNGCYAYDTLVVAKIQLIFSDLKVNHINCGGNAAGSFSHGAIIVSNPLTDAHWQVWDNQNKVLKDTNITNKTGGYIVFRDQIAGTYAFYGKDVQGCELWDTVFVQEIDILRLSVNAKPTTCFKDNGEIALQITGGVLPYKLTIEDVKTHALKNPTNKTKDTVSNLSTSIYLVKVVDKNNCIVSDTAAVVPAVVQEIPLASVLLTEKAASIEVNENKTLTVVFFPTDACNQKTVWKSRDAKIATVTSTGKIKGVSNGNTYIVITSEDGNLQDSCFVTVFSDGVGVEELTVNGERITIYPNPTTGQLQVTSYELQENEMVIFDIYGRNVETLRATSLQDNIINIDISHLPAGVYFLKIKEKVIKFVKL